MVVNNSYLHTEAENSVAAQFTKLDALANHRFYEGGLEGSWRSCWSSVHFLNLKKLRTDVIKGQTH